MMKRFFKRLIIILFILGVGLGIFAGSLIDEAPTVKQSKELNQRELTRMEQFVRANNPQEISDGKRVQTQISQTDFKLLIGYVLQRMEVNIPKFAQRQVASIVSLQKDQAVVVLSVGLPEYGKDTFINIRAKFITTNENGLYKSELSGVKIGKFSLPPLVVKFLVNKIHTDLKNEFYDYDLITQSIKNVVIEEKNITVNYIYNKQLVAKIQHDITSRLIPENLKQALIAQSNQLAFSSQRLEMQPSVNELLRPMFELAQERSQFSDPIVENRAVFVVIGAYTLNKNIAHYFDQKNKYIFKTHKTYLHKRHDLSRHFMASAAITSVVDPALAKTIGLQKEISDSDGGSGFSFIDLAADYAGISLAKYAIENEFQARRVQKLLAGVKQESVYMPAIDKLPEGIFRPDLKSSFKSSKQYMEMEALIIERIQQLPIYMN